MLVLAAHESERAGRELRRYLYLATGQAPALQLVAQPALAAWAASGIPAVPAALLAGSAPKAVIVLGQLPWAQPWWQIALAGTNATPQAIASPLPDAHLLHTLPSSDAVNTTWALGASRTSVLYAVYTLIERTTAIRFRLHGDVLPAPHTAIGLPAYAERLTRLQHHLAVPAVPVRGLQARERDALAAPPLAFLHWPAPLAALPDACSRSTTLARVRTCGTWTSTRRSSTR